MRWIKKAQSGRAEVLYPVSLCSFQWAYVSHVGTVDRKRDLRCSAVSGKCLKKAFRKPCCRF